MSSLCHLEQINERHIFKYLVNWDSFDDSDHKTMVMMKMILPSLAARRQPPCLSCLYDFGPNSPSDGDFDGDDDDDRDDDDGNDIDDAENHDEPEDITLILLIVAESPSGLLLRLAASTRSSSGSGSISTIGLLLRP